MIVQTNIETKLQAGLSPEYLLVENESHMHAVPPNSETHFKVTIVSAGFDGDRLLARHRKVNKLVADELAGPVHALALHTYTPQEWVKQFGSVPESPNCLGGGKG
ncbi:BolA family protein [Glaciecola sp. SC05]|uniref:BolA family protein n=1 Tax=Glaciecola sp. SC05 TaxID=1987355 RepID=UPI003526C987